MLAFMVRRSIGGGASADDGNAIRVLPEQSVSFPEVGNYVTPEQPDKGGITNPVAPADVKPPRTSTGPFVPTPRAPPAPKLPAPKVPAPNVPAPQKPTPGPPPPPTTTTPGGYPTDCTGVVAQANAATSFQQVYNDKKKAGLGDRISRDIATQTAIQGIATMPGLGLTAIAVYIQGRANWPLVNTTRRSRGLKALTSTQFAALELWLNTETARNAGKSLNDAQGQQLWETYNTPFRCANTSPRANMGAPGGVIGPKRTL